MTKVSKFLYIPAVITLAIMMLFGGYYHIANPAFYNEIIPELFPKLIVNYFSAVVEIIIGVLILTSKWRKFGSLAFIGLMIAFFPLHIWDLLKDDPAIGSKLVASIRLVVQFIFIGIGWFVYKESRPKKV